MAAQMAYRIQQLHRKFPAAAADDGGSHDASGAGRQRPDFDYPCIQYVCKQWSCIVADTQWHRQSADVSHDTSSACYVTASLSTASGWHRQSADDGGSRWRSGARPALPRKAGGRPSSGIVGGGGDMG